MDNTGFPVYETLPVVFLQIVNAPSDQPVHLAFVADGPILIIIGSQSDIHSIS